MKEGGTYQQQNPKGPNSSQVSKQGAGGAVVATPIAPQEAAKKYPAAKGKYPMGERDPITPMVLSTVLIHPGPRLTAHRSPTVVLFSTRTSIRSLSGRSSVVIRNS